MSVQKIDPKLAAIPERSAVSHQGCHLVELVPAASCCRKTMQGNNPANADLIRASVQLPHDGLPSLKGSSAQQWEQKLLGELLDLISSDQVLLARKLIGDASMHAHGPWLRDQGGKTDG